MSFSIMLTLWESVKSTLAGTMFEKALTTKLCLACNVFCKSAFWRWYTGLKYLRLWTYIMIWFLLTRLSPKYLSVTEADKTCQCGETIGSLQRKQMPLLRLWVYEKNRSAHERKEQIRQQYLLFLWYNYLDQIETSCVGLGFYRNKLSVLRKMIIQILQGLSFIHKHGDLQQGRLVQTEEQLVLVSFSVL